jgi:protein-L-isoaspartate(D-aspartate) O-methyltransferase
MRDTTVVQRDRMVDRDLAGRGIVDLPTLEAMRDVPREMFVPEPLREFAYEDSPLPIAEGQTISQPYIVALMVQALELEGGEVILDVGTGSGYAAAILSRIASSVFSIERHEALCDDLAGKFEDRAKEFEQKAKTALSTTIDAIY